MTTMPKINKKLPSYTLSRLPRWLKFGLGITALAFITVNVVIGWLVSSKLLAINPQTVAYDQTVIAIQGDQHTITGSAYNVSGIIGAIRSDGSMIGTYSPPFQLDDKTKTSVRAIHDTTGAQLVVGQKISLQGNIWTTDPLQALDIPYSTVTYPGPLGDLNAWLIPATSNTVWTIGVHGIGADKTEMLRFVKPVIAANNTMMIINYRNDVSSPRSPDNRNHLSDTEWQDLEAAVRYAETQGANNIRLYGDSLGGSIVENYLKRSPDVARLNISRVVLDSPALDWKQVVQAQLKLGGYPTVFYYPATIALQLRAGISLNQISTTAPDIKHETLIIHNAKDRTVPLDASKRLALARPDKVRLVDFGNGGHLRSWNYDQSRYDKLVTDFLSK